MAKEPEHILHMEGDRLKFKRVIDGKAYSLKTAMLLHEKDVGNGVTERLYRSRRGDFHFLTRAFNDVEFLVVIDEAETKRWLRTHVPLEQREYAIEPQGYPATVLTLRIDPIFKAKLSTLADSRGISRNQLCVKALEEFYSAQTIPRGKS